jgi:NADPH:quinone reductase-like Zn-dependent oxidoreductase
LKAIVYTEYGAPDVLALKEVEKPAPKDNEVLTTVRAACENGADWHFLRAHPFITLVGSGLLAPKYRTLGADTTGRVEAVIALGQIGML